MKFPDKESLLSRYKDYSDDEIIQILKKQKSYQKEAVEAATEIALERSIISNEQELKSDKYNLGDTSGFVLFPRLNTAEQAEKVLKSLSRILYLLAVVPIIYALLNYYGGDTMKAIIWMLIGVIGFVLIQGLVKKKQSGFSWILIFLILGVVSYFLLSSNLIRVFSIIDWIILVISVTVIVYSILYIRFILKDKS